jgi:hypothetical protein
VLVIAPNVKNDLAAADLAFLRALATKRSEGPAREILAAPGIFLRGLATAKEAPWGT